MSVCVCSFCAYTDNYANDKYSLKATEWQSHVGPSFGRMGRGTEKPCRMAEAFRVKVPDGVLEHLLEKPWSTSSKRFLSFDVGDKVLEKLLRKLLLRGSKAINEALIPLNCVLSRYDDGTASCQMHSHKFGQLTLVVGGSRPILMGDTALVLNEGDAVHIAEGTPHGVPEQHSTCSPRVSINLFVATQAQASASLVFRSLEQTSNDLCTFRWARPGQLVDGPGGVISPSNDFFFELWAACCDALGEPPRKRARHTDTCDRLSGTATVPDVPAIPVEWGLDSKVLLDFAGLCEGAKTVCLQRLQKVIKDKNSVRDINNYCSTVIKGVSDTFGAKLPLKLSEALNAKLAGSGWTIDDLDSSAVGALAGLPQDTALEMVDSFFTAQLCKVSNLSAFIVGAVRRQKSNMRACPVAQALKSGWESVVRAFARKSEVATSGASLVQVIDLACKKDTLESFEVACSALLRFPQGCTPPLSAYNRTFKAAGHVGRWPKALELFKQMLEHVQPNRYTYTALFDAVVRGGGPQTTLFALWNDMQWRGVAADQQLMSTMLQGCADSQVVEELLGELDWQGTKPCLELLTSMVGCYRRAGAPTGKTWELLKRAKRLQESDSLTLDCQFLVQIVAALGFANDTGAVVLLIESVQDVYKVKPDVFLYTAGISQCARAGDVTGAETLVTQMHRDGVEPNEHTHCAIIAVYSKAGLLPKAVNYFNEVNAEVTLPIEAYCSVLSGCRAVLDHNCALRVLKKARRHFGDQTKSACYTLTRQCCALAGNEIGAAKVDKWQKEDGVATHVPTSTVDDPSTGKPLYFEPGIDNDEAVTAYVERMIACLKTSGYNPQLWQYDPEISNEEREERLRFHTEKKALAWALGEFPAGSSITIRKTIRCCVDCHNAFKIASSVYGRTLRILDQVRMHEFTAGKCSCGDWW